MTPHLPHKARLCDYWDTLDTGEGISTTLKRRISAGFKAKCRRDSTTLELLGISE